MTESSRPVPYSVLQARGVGARSGETLNAGIVLHAAGGAMVAITKNSARLRALHPDYSAVHLAEWAAAVENALRECGTAMPEPVHQHAMLPLLVHPFSVCDGMGTALVGDDPSATLRELMAWLVDSPTRTLKVAKRTSKKPTSRLGLELRSWLKQAKAFSSKIEDLSRNRVVANYPVDLQTELYADFALMNGRLHVMEVMDLRGIEKLNSSMRGEAAIKGMTLEEAKDKANRVGIIAASDYGVAKPAINMIQRYADDLFDLGSPSERTRLAAFVAKSLHRKELELGAPLQ